MWQGVSAGLVGALILMAPGAQADQWNKHWTVGAHPELHVEARDASILIEATDSHDIEATLTTRGYSIGPSGVHVVERQAGDAVQIDVQEPSDHLSFGMMHSIHLEVHVPRNLIAQIHTGDGSVDLRGLHGPIRADTGDGSIQGSDLDGSLDAHTGDGSIHITGRFDNLQLRTQDGSVQLDIAHGSRMQSDWHVHTGDGSVHVVLPKDLAANVELETGDGSLHFDMPMVINGMQNQHEIRGKLNGGGPLLEVRTGDGSISIGSN